MATSSEARRGPPRRAWILTGFILLLLWAGAVAGGLAYAHSGNSSPSCQPWAYCINSNEYQNAMEHYPCTNLNQGPITDRNCWAGASGGGGSSGPSCDPYAVQYCWAQPTCGGDNAPNQCGAAVHASSCPSGCANVCTPNGTVTEKFQYCTTSCHTGEFQGYNSCGSTVGGAHTGYAAGCTSGCTSPPPAPTCTGTYHWAQTACTNTPGQAVWTDYGPCGQVLSQDTGNATPGTCVGPTPPPSNSPPPAPSCTPSSATSCSAPVWTGCSSQGVALGIESCTTTHTCPNAQSTSTRSVTQSTTACQPVTEHQCAYAQPGYAQSETCLTSPTGGVTDCSGWSTPYYDPHDCPIPTPVND